MNGFQGFVALEADLPLVALVRNTSNTPINSDALPTYRVYGPNGLMTNGSGAMSFKDSGSITGATNANPIVVTSVAHGLTTGTRVTITGVGGNTNANTTTTVTVLTADTFSLDGVAGNSAYTSGGTWNVAGLYTATIEATAANGYDAGETYTVIVSGKISTTSWADSFTFVVA